jgi:hypothetical protein
MGTKSNSAREEQSERATRTFQWFYRINTNPKYLKVDLAVAVQLTKYVNRKTGDTYVGAKRLSDNIGVSVRSVLRSVRRLQEGGDLGVEWGAPGRGHSNRYWPILPLFDEEKSGTVVPVFDHVKVASVAAAAASGVGPSGPPHRRKKGKPDWGAGGGSAAAAVPYPQALAALRGIWVRGWSADASEATRKVVEKAWAAALARGATAEAILAAAPKHVAAADEPRYLDKLQDWLNADSWASPPRKRGGSRHKANGSRRPRSNGHNAKDAIINEAFRRMQ